MSHNSISTSDDLNVLHGSYRDLSSQEFCDSVNDFHDLFNGAATGQLITSEAKKSASHFQLFQHELMSDLSQID